MFQFLNHLPQVTKNILLLNILMFVLMHVFLATGGIDLSRYLSSHYVSTPLFEPYQLVSHMFMHSPSDFMHIFFNMFLLVIFGSHLERLWGPKRFFIFYILSGVGAFVLDNIIHGYNIYQIKEQLSAANVNIEGINNLVKLATQMTTNELNTEFNSILSSSNLTDAAPAVSYFQLSLVSGLGASGALFGLLAAFAILFPNTELYLMFIPVPIKAKYLIGVYVLYEIYKSFSAQTDNVNHLAHLGGAITGAIIVMIWRKNG